MPALKTTIIAAGNYGDFSNYCNEIQLSIHDRNVIYLNSGRELMGRCLCTDCADVIVYLTFPNHPNFNELNIRLRQAMAMGHLGG